ncbi:hypothetical protein BGZ47_011434 [Haplosporangium gracile]|nr:hypothetical protein BGZ47_011434 [Haplosporangium gracile]
MIQSLPVIMSPTIPSWTAPPRSTTGGKQPGKVPTVSLNLGASSDDSSGSGDDSDSDSSDVGSENATMSEVDMSRSRNQIGRKTARRRNSKTESIGGKRPAGPTAGKTLPDSIRQPGMDSHARKTSTAQYCNLMTSGQVTELPRRYKGMVLSSSPVVVKINIPAYLLPTLAAATQAAERTRASQSSKSFSRGGYKGDSSDDDRAMDVDAPSGAEKEKSHDSSRPTLKDVQGRSSRLQEIPLSPPRTKSLSKRGRSYSSNESESDDRKKPKGSTKELKEKSSFDITHSDKKRLLDKSAALNTDTKRGQTSTTSSRARSDTAEEKSYRTDRGDEKRGSETSIRGKSSQSLSPVLDRNKGKNRRPSYHSADEASDDSRKDRRRSKDTKQNNDHTETGRSRLESKDVTSRAENGQGRKRDISRDRVSDVPDARRKVKEENAKESKEKTTNIEKPTSSSASKDRRLSKDEDVSVSSRAGPKNEPKSDRTGSAAAPGSPGRRSARDAPKETKSRGEKESRDAAAPSGQRSTNSTKDRARGRSRTPSRTRSRSRSPRRYDRNRSPSRNDARDGKSNRDRREYDDDRSSRRKRDGSRDRNDRSGRGRSRDRFGRDRSRDKSTDRNRDRSPARGTSRERSRDRKRARSRSRERGDGRKETDRRARETSATPSSSNAAASRPETRTDARPDSRPDTKSQPPHQDSTKNASGRRDSESKHGASTTTSNPPRPPPPTIKEEPPVQPPPPTTAPPDTISRSGVTGVVKETIVKRVSIEDYQRKKTNLAATDKVDTPKAASDSPALANAVVATGKPPIIAKESTQKPVNTEQKSSSTSSSKLSSETAKKIADYHNTFNMRRAAGITFKHNADDTLKNQSNAKLGAIQYFLSAIEFIAAFHANDKYHNLLNPGRQDVAVKASINSWDTMRQFIHALTNQCHSNRLAGLDGVSALMEVLVYYKVYSYHIMNLRKEMLKSGQFKSKGAPKDENGVAPMVSIPQEMANRMLQNVEDWAHIQKRMDDCRQWLTPDIAQKQFPQTFEKWCIHPDQIGQQQHHPFDGFVSGTNIQKIHWPLGMHLHLHELMAFVESALEEYQKRNGLEHTK